ncbi:MAG: glycosyltransferase family 39 protein, partial [Pseudomonadota bacterium]|nr:glycosyltransferase family 39 protein [Pseudomonadota bacterium]
MELGRAGRSFAALRLSPAISGLAALPPFLGLALAAVAVAALNPVGYIGGGTDDWQYLVAAECWAESGACLPHDHWSARWPLIAPMAGALALFGESRFTVGLVPFLFALAALFLLCCILERLFGRTAAVIGGAALLTTPVFALSLVRPNVDVVELAFLLGALAAALAALDRRNPVFAAVAGGALALAVLTRETSFVFAALFALWFLRSPASDRKILIWAAPGFALPLAAEIGTYWLAAGDPLRRLALAFNHTRIPSTELSPAVDVSRSPLFNPDFIAGWKRSNGIEIHWTVDPVLNLLT